MLATPHDPSRPLSLPDVLRRAVDAVPDKDALVDHRTRLTFADLDARSDKAAAVLADLGARRGDRVAVSLPNEVGIVLALLGAWKLGAVYVGVHRVLAPPERQHILGDCEPTVSLGDWAGAIGPDEWLALVEQGAPEPPDTPVDPLAPAAIAYTSGTTGRPKGVVHSQHNALLPGAVAVARGSFGPDDVFVSVHPLTILNLAVLNPLTALQSLSTVALTDGHDAPTIARWVRDVKGTHLSVVPTVMYELLTHPDVDPADLATLTKPRTGGAAMPEPLKQLFEERFGQRPCTGYGLTEGPTHVCRQDPWDELVPGSAGRPLPHIRVEIRSDDGRRLGPGEIGEVCFGPMLEGEWAGVYRPMLGYWNDVELTDATLRDGLVHSGDLGYLDERDELFLVDRKNQLIIRGGSNIYPAEVERVLGADPRVADCCVVGRPDERYGEVVLAFVETAPGADVTPAELEAVCRAELSAYKVPADIRLVDALPRGAMGKVARDRVKAMAAATPLAGGG